MMKYIITLGLFFCFLIGCSPVETKYPIGLTPHVPLKSDWEGTWLVDNKIITIKVLNGPKGIIQLGWIENDESELKFEKVNCELLNSENGIYVNASQIPGEDFGENYIWGKVNIDNNKILVWPPKFEAFKSAYLAKQLKAKIKKNSEQEISNLQLVDSPANILKVIEKNNTFFEWEKPIVLMRVFESNN